VSVAGNMLVLRKSGNPKAGSVLISVFEA